MNNVAVDKEGVVVLSGEPILTCRTPHLKESLCLKTSVSQGWTSP